MKYFYSSFAITLIGMLIAFYLGGISAAYICFLLCVLEVSLSFDNAVVNAKVLNTMSKIWQDRFIIFGIPIAVFGMRFLFPLLVVSIASKHGMIETLNFAISQPQKYHEILSLHKNEIYIFGGAFLIMVFFDFFFEKEKEIFWISILENNSLVRALKKVPFINIILIVICGIYLYLYTKSTLYLTAFFSAVAIHILISLLNKIFSSNGVRVGLMGFLYLEVLDASFSFDGVVGAFALSENIFIIMIGLGIGAMFVRSITIYLVERKTLTQFAYLEHGAHYAILALALIMFIKVFHEVGEITTGTIGFAFIFVAFLCSVYKNKTSKLT